MNRVYDVFYILNLPSREVVEVGEVPLCAAHQRRGETPRPTVGHPVGRDVPVAPVCGGAWKLVAFAVGSFGVLEFGYISSAP